MSFWRLVCTIIIFSYFFTSLFFIFSSLLSFGLFSLWTFKLTTKQSYWPMGDLGGENSRLWLVAPNFRESIFLIEITYTSYDSITSMNALKTVTHHMTHMKCDRLQSWSRILGNCRATIRNRRQHKEVEKWGAKEFPCFSFDG